MGCPVSIGPEIILRYFADLASPSSPEAIVLGDLNVLKFNRDHFNIDVDIVPYQPGDQIQAGTIPVLELSRLEPHDLEWGIPHQESGKAMATYITKGCSYALSGTLAGLVTCPITKSVLNLAGFHFPGHTEMLASLTNSDNFAMLMGGKRLKVVLATIHCSLDSVVRQLRTDKLIQLIELADLSLRRDFSIENPRIGVAGLNPHCGEDGLFGSEEETILRPAIEFCKNKGINLGDPQPPDTIFYRAAQGKYDLVVCMYHDQGLIPFKLLHFDDGVNVTLGLPIVRTSVDHGTAYDIAGKGLAKATSLEQAVNWADMMVRNRKR